MSGGCRAREIRRTRKPEVFSEAQSEFECAFQALCWADVVFAPCAPIASSGAHAETIPREAVTKAKPRGTRRPFQANEFPQGAPRSL